MAHDAAAGRLHLGIDAERLADFDERTLVLARLLQIAVPFFAKRIGDGAFDRGLVDLDAASLMLERLQQELIQLFLVHALSSGRRRYTDGGSISRAKWR